MGYEIILSTDGAEALVLVREELPDVILLDAMMIGMDGFELCRRIKGNTKTALIPILLVTALTDRADRLKGIEAGANDFLTKPIDFQDLILRVRNAVYTKSLFDQRQENYEKLKTFERLRDHLTHTIFNDMRKPLKEVSSHLKSLSATGKENFDREQKKHVDRCFSLVSRLMETVNSLVDISSSKES